MCKLNFIWVYISIGVALTACNNIDLQDNKILLPDSCFNIVTRFYSAQNYGFYGTEFDCLFMSTHTLCQEKYSFYRRSDKMNIENVFEKFCYTKTEELTIPEISTKPLIVLKNYEINVTRHNKEKESIIVSWVNYLHARSNVILDKEDFGITSFNRTWEIGDNTVYVESNLSFDNFSKVYPGYKGIYRTCVYDSIAIDWKYYNEDGDVRKFFNSINIHKK